MPLPSDVRNVWQQCLSLFKELVDEKTYTTWFLPIVPVSLEYNMLTLQVPSQFFCEFLETHFVEELQHVLHHVIGPNAGLKYNALVDSASRNVQKGSVTLLSNTPEGGSFFAAPPTPQPAKSTESTVTSEEKKEPFESHLNAKLSFDSFYASECNRVARSVGETIATKPGLAPMNPFFVYGHSGVGKTHLCHAVGLRIREVFPELKVLYVSSHLFELQYTTAARTGATGDFVQFYQQVDVLIIDDIQWFIGKKKTQQTFFHIFNHLYMLGKQIVLTSDKPPVDLNGMEERLVSRIAGALSVELKRPDLSLRREILRRRGMENGITLPENVLDFIAQNVQSNVRELEGTLHSMVAHAAISGCDLNLRLARKIVKQAVKLEKKEVTFSSIEKEVCGELQVSPEAIRSRSRKQDIVLARQIIMYLSKKHTDNSLNMIGEQLGGRTHATVLYGCQAIADQMSIDSLFAERIKALEKQVLE